MLDIITGCFLWFLAVPLMILISIAILVVYGSPVLYSEIRVGLKGRRFRLYKFRTLKNRENRISKSHDLTNRIMKNGHPDLCMGRLARILRKYSLDELPQLWNVLVGHMSIVGPRPMPFNELHYRFGADASKITSVRPGLTGWWQINGRNSLSREDRRRLDLYYVNNKHLRLDLEIILKSFSAILSARGAF